jgi:hypothetical protein
MYIHGFKKAKSKTGKEGSKEPSWWKRVARW